MAGTFPPSPEYIPQNECILCAGVGFDRSYQNVRLFENLDTRIAYFRSKAIYQGGGMEPIRVSEGFVTLDIVADAAFNADYIVMRNNDFDSGRWYFAFVTSVDWIDLHVCRVNYELDVMQTWLDDAILTPCFVERMHWPTDEPGDNLVADNLELGDYVLNHTARTEAFDTYSIVIACTVDASGTPATGGYYGGIYSGLNLLEFRSVTDVNNFISGLESGNQKDAIVAIFMMPREFFKPKSTDITSEPVTITYTYPAPERDKLDTYEPVNKKLLTYPYKFLQASNLSGNSADYHYEYFTTLGPIFQIIGDCSPNPTIKMAPVGYNGYASGDNAYDYGLSLNGFPQCAWATDAYMAWLAQSGSVSALGMTFTGQDLAFAQQGLGAAGQLLTGNILGAAGSFLGIAQNVAQINAIKSLPPQAHGQTANGAMVAFKAKDFQFNDYSIRRQHARIIDGYWTKYGYPCKELRSISLKTRPSYNFIKTIGCNVAGTAPQWARTAIADVFDAGVTMWHTDDIGNYYLPNQP